MAVSSAALLSGCFAEPPPPRLNDGGSPGDGRYASIGRCSPAGGPEACPGEGCGINATGQPDSNGVNLQRCGTLDVVFTSGTALSLVGAPDIAVHLAGAVPANVSVRVEGSADGNEYVIIGFIGSAPTPTPECKANVVGGKALIDASFCNLLSNVNFVRFSEERPGTGNVVIDAVEALSFRARASQ